MNVGTRLTKQGQLNHLKTLKDVVDDYKVRFDFSKPGVNHSKDHDDPVVDFCKAAPSLRVAIERACDGRRADGKMFSKGSCVRTSSKKKLTEELLQCRDRLRKINDFDVLYDLVMRAAPWGIGSMSIYAVSERIGAYLGVQPHDYLYLHAGPLQGWKKLTGCKGNPQRVPRSQVPSALLKLPMYHVENFLCEYREALHPGMLR